MHRLAIFASGTGSNAKKIIEYFKDNAHIEVALVVSNKKDAGVLPMAQSHDVPQLVINRSQFYDTQSILDELKTQQIDFIILAGFLWLIPNYLVNAYGGRMVNIHPALLPKYGGKGMYGMHVHRAVKAAGDKESGMTIHWVNQQYDEGATIFQARCEINEQDTAEDIAKKVLQLEHKHFAPVVEKILLN